MTVWLLILYSDFASFFFFFCDWLLYVLDFFVPRIRGLCKFVKTRVCWILFDTMSALCFVKLSINIRSLKSSEAKLIPYAIRAKHLTLLEENDNSAAQRQHLRRHGYTHTHTTISPLQTPQHEIWRNVSALNQWHTNWTSQVLFNAACAHKHTSEMCPSRI